MRILIAHSFYRHTGGEDRYVRQQLELLSERHEVELLERANADLEEDPDAALRMTYSPSEVAKTRAVIDRFRPDVIHLHNPYPAFGPAVHLAARRSRIPLVMTLHNFRLRCPNGLTFTQGEPCTRCVGGAYWNAVFHDCFPTRSQAGAYAVALAAHRFAFRLEEHVDRFIAPSRFMLDRMGSWGIPTERLVLVRNYAEVPREPPPLGDSGLYLGRLSAEKGVDRLIDALALAGDPRFEVAGEGPEREALERRASGHGLRKVTFLGQLDRAGVIEAVNRARFVVVPSVWHENAPLAASEAMAAGRPLVVTAAGGLPELAADGRGLVVPPGDSNGLAMAIRRFIDDPGEAAEYGARAAAFARSELSPTAHAAGLDAVYHSVIRPIRAEAPPPRARRVFTETRGSVRPRVLMVHCYYRDLGGENLSFEAETALLRSRGHDVVVYARDNREIQGLGLLGKARLGARTVWGDDAYGDVRALIRRERPDVVHVQNTFPLISPSVLHAAHRMGVPVVQALRNYRLLCASGILFRDGRPCEDCIGVPFGTPGIVHRCYHNSASQSAVVAGTQAVHRLLGTWSDAVDLFVAPSQFARSIFVSAGMPGSRITVKPNFVYPDPGPQEAPGSGAVYAGRLAPEKGIMTMLEAWRLSAPMPLVIIGDGPLRSTAEAFVRRHALEHSVEILGPRAPAEVVQRMRGAHVVLFPSEWYETFGRVAAEAFACGVPVIASRIGSMAEVVDDGRTGFLFTSGSPSDLAASVARSLDGAERWAEMGREARAAFERSFTAETNYQHLLNIYARVAPAALASGPR
jgi:glycosyltransferase involved in cell wall biosynthesis